MGKKKSKLPALPSGELSQDLGQLAEEANQFAELVEQHAVGAVGAAVECGRRLVTIKSRVGHGGWGKWLGQNWLYDQRTAERYMSLAEHSGAIADAPTMTRALQVIADIREVDRVEAGKSPKRKPEPEPEPEPEAEPEERWETEPEVDPDDWGKPIDPPTIAVPTPREPQPAEPVRRVHLDELPAGDETAEPFVLQMRGEVWIDGDGKRIPFVAPADRLHWIGYDGVELVQNPLELLDYIAWMVSEAEPEQVQAVVRGCMGLVSYLEGHSDE
jgi:hypothetical protein